MTPSSLGSNKNRRLGTGLFFVSILFASHALAFDFGQNKVRYHEDRRWKINVTDHFKIYYYPECEAMAQKATEIAENAFLTVSQVFDYVPKTKIPIFLYGTPSEFAETNISPELLGEGVGGFTEVFKNRIVVPMGGSYHELEKVITHEMTHAFQYDLIYGEGWRSLNLFKSVFVPNWMMEGMAEWTAQHLDGQGEMVLRDAILNDQVIPLRLLESFDHFEQVYMAYKESQSILDYVSQVYGHDKVAKLFKKMASGQSPDGSVKAILGVSLDALYENWHFFLKSKTWARIAGMPSPEKYGEKLEEGVFKAAVSPDGKEVAILKGGELDLWDPAKKRKTDLLHKEFETQGSGLAWSPDGTSLAFAAKKDGEVKLYTMDVKTKAVREIPVPGMPLVYSPNWSPDGRFLIFSAFDYSTVDLYRVDRSSLQVEKLTQDQDTKSWACYSSDGKSIYYLAEKGGETHILKVSLGAGGIPSEEPVPMGGELGQISSFRLDHGEIYLTSNRGRRIFNLYRMDLNGKRLIQMSRTYTDILSVAPAPGGSVFYVNLYQKSHENLYAWKKELLEEGAPEPENLIYLANSFQDADQLIAASTPVPLEKDEDSAKPEEEKSKKQPTQAPGMVPDLEVAQASNIVLLEWPAQGVGEDSVDRYQIYRATNPKGPFSKIGSTPDGKTGRFTDYQVVTGKNYSYYVTAVNKIGESRPSPKAGAHPLMKLTKKDYDFEFSPDLLLFIAGYDSGFGFVGGGVAQFSDMLGNHRLGIVGDTIPGVRTGVEANYEFSQWRTTVDLDFYYYQNFLQLFDLQTGNLVSEYRNNENGLDLTFKYPLNASTRIEYGVGTQRFQGTPLYLQFSEGISNYSQNSDQWNVANYYRLSFVKDERKGTEFWPSSGYALNFTLLHALKVLDSNLSFANLMFETQAFADLSFLNHLIWANRWIGMTSQGPNPQTFFIGEDDPFQAFFTTIRGYGSNTYFGNDLALWNTELRYPLATQMNFEPKPIPFVMVKDIELAGFADVGWVGNQLSDLEKTPVLASAGVGLRLYTFLYQRALVMLRFDVAWRLDRDFPPTFYFNLAPIF